MIMNLEVITRTPRKAIEAPPLLFVHGAFAGAWVWEPHFLPYFAERGFQAHALSLRGHGFSHGGSETLCARISDYVQDVASVASGLDSPPIVIGHSMGGMVAQHFVRSQPAAGLVLLSSAPPHGLMGCWLNMLLNHPQLLGQMAMLESGGANPLIDADTVRRALFSDDTSDDVLDRFMPRMRMESPLAVLDLWGLDLPLSGVPGSFPVLVLGAENDPFIHPGAVRATAWAYGTEADVLPGIAHAMMLDHHWQVAASRILEWIDAFISLERRAPSVAAAE